MFDWNLVYAILMAIGIGGVLILGVIFGKNKNNKDTVDRAIEIIDTIDKYDDFVAQLLIDRGLPEEEVWKYVEALEKVLAFAKSTQGTVAERQAATEAVAFEALKAVGIQITDEITELIKLVVTISVAIAGNIK